jgi:hypothetical protein
MINADKCDAGMIFDRVTYRGLWEQRVAQSNHFFVHRDPRINGWSAL